MSYIFRGQSAPLSHVHFEGYTFADTKGIPPGELWLDNTLKQLQFQAPGGLQGANGLVLYANGTQVSLPNPTTATNLMGFSFPAQSLNVAGKGFWFHAFGDCAPNTTSDTLTVSAYLGTSGTNVSLFSILTGTITAGNTTGWEVCGYTIVLTTGSSGTVICQARLTANIGTGTTTTTVITHNAATSAIDLTSAESFQMQGALTTGHTSSVVDQNSLLITSIN